jgi:hypothetical protein
MMEAPISLYRYRGYSLDDTEDDKRRERVQTEIKHALMNQTWFSGLSAQNDPFDTNPHFVYSKEGELDKFMRRFEKATGQSVPSFSGIDMLEAARKRGMNTKQAKAAIKKIPKIRQQDDRSRSNKHARKASHLLLC